MQRNNFNPTRVGLLHDDQEKYQFLDFMRFCLKRWRHVIVDPIFDLKILQKWTQIKYQD